MAAGTIVLGLAVHWGGKNLPPSMRDVVGDALWGAMIFWWASALAPHARVAVRAAAAVAFCWAIELSQMVHPAWLESLRATTLGHLALGSDFDLRDFAAYAAGVIATAVLDLTLRRRGREV